MAQRYNYVLSKGKITKVLEKEEVSLDYIKGLEINTLTDKEVQSRYIILRNNDHSNWKSSELNNEGKWIITFKKGDSEINQVWKKAVSLIFEKKEVHQIKAPAVNDDFDTQTIIIYTKDTLDDVVRVFELIETYGLNASSALDIKYKYQSDTTFDNLNRETKVSKSESDQVSYIPAHVPLISILLKLRAHDYVLHGGGVILNGKSYSKSAGLIVKKIEELFKEKINFKNGDEIDQAEKHCQDLLSKIYKELENKAVPTSGSCFFGLGAREESTATLYQEILTLIPKEIKEKGYTEQTKLIL